MCIGLYEVYLNDKRMVVLANTQSHCARLALDKCKNDADLLGSLDVQVTRLRYLTPFNLKHAMLYECPSKLVGYHRTTAVSLMKSGCVISIDCEPVRCGDYYFGVRDDGQLSIRLAPNHAKTVYAIHYMLEGMAAPEVKLSLSKFEIERIRRYVTLDNPQLLDVYSYPVDTFMVTICDEDGDLCESVAATQAVLTGMSAHKYIQLPNGREAVLGEPNFFGIEYDLVPEKVAQRSGIRVL